MGGEVIIRNQIQERRKKEKSISKEKLKERKSSEKRDLGRRFWKILEDSSRSKMKRKRNSQV